ncbi:hypothetical protein V8E51_000451, partial [Hyaloscypha variabilis]
MEATDEEVNSVLTDALNGYLKIISLEQKLHEASQPRRGKSVETETDAARIQYFQSRISVAETCLQFAGRISTSVKAWAAGEPEKLEKNVTMEDLMNLMSPSVDRFLLPVKEDDEPFLNPLTGQWIQPINSPQSAGPSNWRESCMPKDLDYPKKEKINDLPPTAKGKDEEGTTIVLPQEVEDLIDLSISDVHEPSNPPHFSDFFGLLHETSETSYITTERDNIQPSLNPFSDHYQSPDSPGFDTPRTSTSHTQSRSDSPAHSFKIAPLTFEAELAAARKLQSEWAQDDAKYELPTMETTSVSQFDLKYPPVESSTSINQFQLDYPPIDTNFELDLLTAQRLQAEYDTEQQEQESYARQVQRAEQDQFSYIDGDMAEARRLQSEWEAQDASAQQDVQYWQTMWQQEDQQMAAQAEFARGLLREEEDRAEGIKKDVAAALAAQTQWEADAIELQKQVKRAAEEADRREAEERERLEREEAARRAEEERRAKMAECVSCMEEGERKDMLVLGCTHAYCGGCIAEAVKSALKSRTPFKCCKATPPAPSLARFLSAPLLQSYNVLLLELSTPNPKYCSNARCSLFLAPSSITGPLAICPSCRTRTCALCSGAEHPGVCKQDLAGQKVLELAGKKGWKSCPNCNFVLERTEG